MNGRHFLPLIVLLAAGCDHVDQPLAPGGGNNGGGGGGEAERRVFLEEFTGHRCNTCPAAHETSAQLKALYGDGLVLMNIHSTANPNSNFTTPISPPNPDGSFSTDFRTPEGLAWAGEYAIAFIPVGLVSRKPYNGSTTLSQSTWGSAIAEIIGSPAAVDLWFETVAHNAAAHTVSVEVKAAVRSTLVGEHRITVCLAEDHVFDWQLNSAVSPPEVENYDHRHVFRKTLGGAWGQTVVAAQAAVGDTLTLAHSNVAVDPAWDPANLELVAYLYQSATNEVLQVTLRKLIP